LEPVEHALGGRHHLRVLAVAQIMTRATIPVAQRMHNPMQRADTPLDATLAQQQRLQVAQCPCRHGQTVRLRPGRQRRFHERACRLVERGRPPTP
jgi:hypothetical protein